MAAASTQGALPPVDGLAFSCCTGGTTRCMLACTMQQPSSCLCAAASRQAQARSEGRRLPPTGSAHHSDALCLHRLAWAFPTGSHVSCVLCAWLRPQRARRAARWRRPPRMRRSVARPSWRRSSWKRPGPAGCPCTRPKVCWLLHPCGVIMPSHLFTLPVAWSICHHARPIGPLACLWWASHASAPA